MEPRLTLPRSTVQRPGQEPMSLGPTDGNPVVASVDGYPIYLQDLGEVMRSLPEQMRHRDAAQAAAESPEELATIHQTRIARAELNRRLLRGTDVAGGIVHQSTNMNSEVLKINRHRLAIPFFCANESSFFSSAGVGSRLSAS